MMLTETEIKPLTETQLAQYIQHVGFLPVDKSANGYPSQPILSSISPNLANLTRLMQRHLCAIPFANTFVHCELVLQGRVSGM